MTEQPPTEDEGQESVAPPARRSGYWRQILLGALILVCGMAIGSAGTVILIGNRPHSRVLQTVRQRESAPRLMTERLQRDLRMSPEQASRVEAIVRKRLEAIWQIREEQRPRITEQFELMKKEVAEVLDPDQAKRWTEQFERFLRSGAGPPRRGERSWGHGPGKRPLQPPGAEPGSGHSTRPEPPG
jgi:protein-tyrosine-phosphatase